MRGIRLFSNEGELHENRIFCRLRTGAIGRKNHIPIELNSNINLAEFVNKMKAYEVDLICTDVFQSNL